LRSQGFRVVRIPNNEILTNLSGVLQNLLSVMRAPPPPCGGARLRIAQSEGGQLPSAQFEETPLPTLPHKGGGDWAPRGKR
jgi:hypothetical protein